MSALTSLQSSAKATPTRAVSPDARNTVQGPRDENTRNVENSAPLTAAAQRLAVLSNLPPDEQPTELLANTMRILDRVSDLETHVKFLTHHIQQLLAAGGAVTPGQTPASTPHATPAFGLSPARESASPPPQQQFNPFQPLVPYATAAQMAAPPPPPPQA